MALIDVPKVIAHRGASGTAPENTLAAIVRASDLGATAIELDVTISGDGVAVMLHDEDVERTSNGNGPITQKTINEIQKLDAGSWFDGTFAGEPIPTLKQAMKTINKHKLFFNMEIKPSAGLEEKTAKIVADEVNKNWQANAPMLVSSTSEVCLQTFQKINPQMPCGLIVDNVPENWREIMQRNNCVSIHFHYSNANLELVKEIKSAGYSALVYTVDDPMAAKDMFVMGVDGVFTNFPEMIMPVTECGSTN
ncbi:MAG: glycerophosphodiester phosphodiesterase [Rhodospirillaceae bacterium]|nr:glycerophosphodiester phosphodiesterase [Rhodospirillaceae bacterium]